MPTNLETRRDYGISPVTIFADTPSAANMVTFDTTFLQADADGNQILEAGRPLMAMASGLGRAYPYTTVAVLAASGVSAVTVANARYFKVGDTVTIARPYMSITLSGSFANGVTITTQIDNTTTAVPTLTVSGYVDLATLAGTLAAYLNAAPAFADRATAIADGAIIHVYGKAAAGLALVLAASAGTFTASATSLQANVAVGTIAAAGINATTNVITFASTISVRLPVGAPLAIPVDRSAILGLAGYQYLLGTISAQLEPESNDIPAYYDAAVYAARIPVPMDRWMRDALPEIVTRPR